jgi:hypothetical protein
MSKNAIEIPSTWTHRLGNASFVVELRGRVSFMHIVSVALTIVEVGWCVGHVEISSGRWSHCKRH